VVTAGGFWIIRLARDGDASQDGSTTASYPFVVTIEYGASQ
jgi:hypothetical protein